MDINVPIDDGDNDDAEEDGNRTRTVTKQEKDAATQWPALQPATSAPWPTVPPRGEPGRRARGRAGAKMQRAGAVLAAASTMVVTGAWAVA